MESIGVPGRIFSQVRHIAANSADQFGAPPRLRRVVACRLTYSGHGQHNDSFNYVIEAWRLATARTTSISRYNSRRARLGKNARSKPFQDKDWNSVYLTTRDAHGRSPGTASAPNHRGPVMSAELQGGQQLDNLPLNAQELAQLARFRHDEPAQHATVAPAATRAERFADSVTAAVGSWRFLIAQSIVFTAWIVLNKHHGLAVCLGPLSVHFVEPRPVGAGRLYGADNHDEPEAASGNGPAPGHDRIPDQRPGRARNQAAAPED